MSMREIHPQAVVAASTKLGEGVKIGAYAVVGEDVELGDGCVLHAHATVGGPSRFGKNTAFYSFSAIGSDPQDYTFRGERTELVVGDGNIFREYVTISRGTQKGGGKTSLGDGNFLLAYSHVLPDWPLRVHRGVDGNHSGCAAVFQNRHRARNEELRN